MSELLARLQVDLNASRKAQDKPATLLLGTVLSEIKNRRIELRRDPEDGEVVDVLRKAIKKRRWASVYVGRTHLNTLRIGMRP